MNGTSIHNLCCRFECECKLFYFYALMYFVDLDIKRKTQTNFDYCIPGFLRGQLYFAIERFLQFTFFKFFFSVLRVLRFGIKLRYSEELKFSLHSNFILYTYISELFTYIMTTHGLSTCDPHG